MIKKTFFALVLISLPPPVIGRAAYQLFARENSNEIICRSKRYREVTSHTISSNDVCYVK